MTDLLALAYPWIKAIHIMAVITWMAGIFYPPRLFVYHPSLIAVWIFGLLLVMTPGIVDWSAIWPWAKAISVIAMTWFHMWLGKRRKDFAAGSNMRSGRSYRMMNEVPTILMFVIVIAVVVKF